MEFAMLADAETSVRNRVASATKAAHQRLHRHPVLRLLAEPRLSADVYEHIIRRYAELFAAIEARRAALGVLPRLKLTRQVAALFEDAGDDAATSPDVQRRVDDIIQCPSSCLGGLYVLHGSAFGNNTMLSSVRRALPSRPTVFLALGSEPTVWRALLAELETRGRAEAEEQRITDAAEATFGLFYDHTMRAAA
ncbi:MAG: biliverdin-producing heme oxygenase [Pseudomonadota bacterium]